MKIVVGLGNPGAAYSLTRHNLGFLVIEALKKKWGIVEAEKKKRGSLITKSYLAKGEQSIPVLLVKPQTFMNHSGAAVGALQQFYRLPAAAFLIVTDDYYLPFAAIRFRSAGSSGGHNGLKGIEKVLGKGYPRLRGGIGKQEKEKFSPVRMETYVLEKFSKTQQQALPSFTLRLAEAVETYLKEGAARVMNRFNQKVPQTRHTPLLP